MRTASILASVAVMAGCIEFSPFETDLSAAERDQTRKNLAALAAAPQPEESFRFAVVGDSHQHVDDLAEIVEHINRRSDIAFTAHLGDMTDLGLREEYRATLGALQGLHAPFVALIGNHDAISNGKILYREMFGAFDFEFRFGFARFVCINSNSLEFESAPDLAWLDEHAGKPRGERLLALSHQPSRTPDYAAVLRRGEAAALVTAHRHAASVELSDELLKVAVGTAQLGDWAVVHVTRNHIGVERCTWGACEVWEP